MDLNEKKSNNDNDTFFLSDPILIIALPCHSTQSVHISPHFEFCSNGWIWLKLLHRFVKIDTWISLSCYMDCKNCCMDLSKLSHGFIKVVLYISCPLPNKTKVKFDQVVPLAMF